MAERIAHSQISLNRGEHRIYPFCKRLTQKVPPSGLLSCVPSQRGLFRPPKTAPPSGRYRNLRLIPAERPFRFPRTRPRNGRLPTHTVTSQHPQFGNWNIRFDPVPAEAHLRGYPRLATTRQSQRVFTEEAVGTVTDGPPPAFKLSFKLPADRPETVRSRGWPDDEKHVLARELQDDWLASVPRRQFSS